MIKATMIPGKKVADTTQRYSRKAVASHALVGETVKEVDFGSPCHPNAIPYTMYTLWMQSGRGFVVSSCMGEIVFSELFEIKEPK